eukprot:2126921-Amphidinium_carterae.2
MIPVSELSVQWCRLLMCQALIIWPQMSCMVDPCDLNVRSINDNTLPQPCRNRVNVFKTYVVEASNFELASGQWNEDPQNEELQATLSSPSVLWSLVARAIVVDFADASWACFSTCCLAATLFDSSSWSCNVCAWLALMET